jgi:hypothetical protein
MKRRRSEERKKRGLGLISVELEREYRAAIENIPVYDLIKFVPKSIDIGSMQLGSLSARCRIIIGAWLEKHGYLSSKK